MNKRLSLIFSIASHLFVSGVTSKNITLENKCDYTVWPGFSNSFDDIGTTGFALEKGESRVILASPLGSGAIWGRTLCSRNSTGKFSCATGDCGSGEIECAESGESPRNTTLAQFQLNNETVDLYRVNVVYGYNLPVLVVPQRIYYGFDYGKVCSRVDCDVVNLNQACPYDLMVLDAEERPIACTNPCESSDCMPSSYSESFKVPCPEATFDFSDDNYVACTGSTDYVITFCPSFPPIPTRRMSKSPTTESSLINETRGLPKKTTTGAKHNPALKLKVILGISTALLVMITIVASTIVLRAKNARRKSDWSGKNIEAIVMLKRYSYAKVKKMTNSFSHVLGKGGFGTVYKGKLPDGSGTDVAVKILKDSKGNGEEFINEVLSC